LRGMTAVNRRHGGAWRGLKAVCSLTIRKARRMWTR